MVTITIQIKQRTMQSPVFSTLLGTDSSPRFSSPRDLQWSFDVARDNSTLVDGRGLVPDRAAVSGSLLPAIHARPRPQEERLRRAVLLGGPLLSACFRARVPGV